MASSSPAVANKSVVIATYNLLFPQPDYNNSQPASFKNPVGYKIEEDGTVAENSAQRTAWAIDNILQLEPDVLCLQEVTPAVLGKLKEDKQISVLYEFSEPAFHNAFQGVCTLFKKQKFKDVRSVAHTIQLYVANRKRIRCHIATTLTLTESGKVVRVLNAHFLDPRSFSSLLRGMHAREVFNTIDGEKGVDVIAADLNQDQFGDASEAIRPDPSTPSLKLATAYKVFFDAGFEVDDDLSSSEFGRQDPGDGALFSKERRIDWILARGARIEAVDTSELNLEQRASDHRLVASRIFL